jgi:hypothetical protein
VVESVKCPIPIDLFGGMATTAIARQVKPLIQNLCSLSLDVHIFIHVVSLPTSSACPPTLNFKVSPRRSTGWSALEEGAELNQIYVPVLEKFNSNVWSLHSEVRSKPTWSQDYEPCRALHVPPRYNGAPGQEHWVIRQNPKTGERTLDRLWWGLIPHWCKEEDGGRKPINAKAETVAQLPSFRDAYRHRRCLVPIDNFFEWKATKGGHQSSLTQSA